MPHIDGSLVESVAGLDAVRLAVLFIGLITLGLIRLTYLIVKHLGRKP